MDRYWRGTTKDDKFVTEAQGAVWAKEHDNLQTVELVLEDKDQVIKLPKGLEYVQAKTCGANLSTGECQIESRYVGFKLGNNTVRIRVNEKTSDITVEVD